MKKSSKYVLPCLLLVFSLVSCGYSDVGTSSANTSNDPLPTLSENLSIYSAEPTSLPTNDIILPDGWAEGVYPEAWTYYGHYGFENKFYLTDSDLQLGGLVLGSPMDEIEQNIGGEIVSSQENKAEEYSTRSIKYSTDITAMFLDMGVEEGYILYSIETESSQYETFRGVCVGDSVEKLLELYGLPSYIDNNNWEYCWKGGTYILHAFLIENGIITKILVNLVM